MLRTVAIDKIQSYGLTKEEANHILDDIAETHNLDEIYSIRIDTKKTSCKGRGYTAYTR